MNNQTDLIYWEEVKLKLKKKYSHLTNADLEWRYTDHDDLLKTIANGLGITMKEIKEAINQ